MTFVLQRDDTMHELLAACAAGRVAKQRIPDRWSSYLFLDGNCVMDDGNRISPNLCLLEWGDLIAWHAPDADGLQFAGLTTKGIELLTSWNEARS